MRSILLLLCLSTTAFAQDAASWTIDQVTYLKAASAVVVDAPDGDGVMVIAQELSGAHKKALKITVVDQPNDYIEVARLIKVQGVDVSTFPPQDVKATTPGVYIIPGQPGDRFAVSIRSSDKPVWIIAEIEGDPSDPPPVADLTKLTTLVKVSCDTLSDPVTQAAIKLEIEKVLTSFPDSIPLAEAAFKSAIREGLLASLSKVEPPYKDWKNGFREPVSNYISSLNVTDVGTYKQVIEAIVKGL